MTTDIKLEPTGVLAGAADSPQQTGPWEQDGELVTYCENFELCGNPVKKPKGKPGPLKKRCPACDAANTRAYDKERKSEKRSEGPTFDVGEYHGPWPPKTEHLERSQDKLRQLQADWYAGAEHARQVELWEASESELARPLVERISRQEIERYETVQRFVDGRLCRCPDGLVRGAGGTIAFEAGPGVRCSKCDGFVTPPLGRFRPRGNLTPHLRKEADDGRPRPVNDREIRRALKDLH